MRTVLAVALLAVVVLAGCSGLSAPRAGNGTAADAAEATPTGTPTDGAGTATTPADEATTAAATARPDPATDRLGWEAGYWHNESIAVDNGDGMNATERRTAVARAMARIEYVRQLEFAGNDTVPTTVVSRATFRNRTLNRSGPESAAARTFANARYEALFLVGEDTDAIATQRTNRASTTQGYYDLRNDSIVLISDTGQPQFNGEETLAQEVGHALQNRRFNVTAMRVSVETHDALNGQNGLVEGDGNLMDERYMARCGEEWECIPSPSSDGTQQTGAADVHVGINMLRYFPYSDGPPFIEYHYDRGGWERINGMYENPPASAEQIIDPAKYPDERPTNVTIADTTDGDWRHLTVPETGPGTGDGAEANATDRFGQGAITTMFAYTVYDDDYRRRGLGVVEPRSFLNFDENGQIDTQGDIFNYSIGYSDGWDGDRFQVYTSETAGTNETAYVWRTEWESAADAREFADGYASLLQYWGGQSVDGRDGVYRIDDEASPFTDAFAVRQSGSTVTVVNAPTTDDLADVSDTVAE